MRLLRTALLLLACGLGSSACDRSRGASSPPVDEAEARRLLVERNWLDVMPRDKDDRLHVYRFVPKMGGGVYQDRTVFAGSFELFTFETQARQIRFRFPHNGQTKVAAFRIERLGRGEQDDFDLRLTLTGSPRGPAVYYGWSDEHRAREAQVLGQP